MVRLPIEHLHANFVFKNTNMSNMEPPSTASPLYKALHSTALGFSAAQIQDDNLSNRMNFDKMRTYCSPSFQHSWGHNYSVSVSPPLQRTHSFDGFVMHLQSMLPRLASWKADVTDVIVDEVRMQVVLRISVWMQGKGAEEKVENDLLWVMEMERLGDGEVRIKGSREFVDGVAAGRLKEVMMGKS
jgi:hypothetical protein